jgi:hypothetical protein
MRGISIREVVVTMVAWGVEELARQVVGVVGQLVSPLSMATGMLEELEQL